MAVPGNEPVALQRDYYARTAARYDSMHDQTPHDIALGHVVGFARWLGARSLLDTGCGTGWGLRVVRDVLPDLQLRGNDPSRDLLDVAIDRYGVRHEGEPEAAGKAIARPSVFVLDRSGIVRFAHVGEDPLDRPTIRLILLALETLE